MALPQLLDGWTAQDVNDPLLDSFSAPTDPINALDAPLRQLEVGAVKRILASKPNLARLPGPSGSTALSIVFHTLLQTQISAQGMWFLCDWNVRSHVLLLQTLLEHGADVWQAVK